MGILDNFLIHFSGEREELSALRQRFVDLQMTEYIVLGEERAAGRYQPAFRARLAPVMSHHRAFLGTTLDVLRLLFEKAYRDKQWEVRVTVAGGLEHPV